MALPGHAQNRAYPWTIGVGFNFRDLDQIPNGVWEDIEGEAAYQMYVGRYLNPSFDLLLNTTLIPHALKNRSREELSDIDLNVRYKLANGYLFNEDAIFAPYLTLGIGTSLQEELNGTSNLSLPLGAGLRLNLGDRIGFEVMGRYHSNIGDFQNYASLSTGVNINIGNGTATPKAPKAPADRDMDGIADINDVCPDIAGLASLSGCPDGDKDGIADKDDECPTVAGIADLKGCPVQDADGDGVADDKDTCPNVAGLSQFNGCPDTDGDGIQDSEDTCPKVAGISAFAGCPDTDADGIQDSKDTCPNVAGIAAFDGCPDTDQDGVKDSEDKCPDVAGTVAMSGCPEVSEEVKEKLEMVKKAVQFETSSSNLKTRSYGVLDTVYKIMQAYPEYSLTVSGYTDSAGAEDKNLTLSQNRAKACADYLISKGIPADKISFVGYGEANPIASNATSAGRAQNRRVEFDLTVK